MKRKSVSAEPEKVHRLTLAELAAHDDACSDTMVDNAYFKSQIRKNKTKYFPLRIKEDDVPQILLHKVIVQKDPAAAEKALLQLSGLKRYRAGLKTKSERENFLKHLRKYIDMYQTDCPWEVSTTNRYTITTYEAAVTARQRVKQGQVIKHLTGTMVPLTTEESNDLDHTNRNFSIVVSSRKKNSSIFLGPARFANHDCDANGRLVTRGSDAMEVIAMKNIEIGDEITVSYGDDYFGPENIDCLCHTCERLVRNGWAGARELPDSARNSILSSQEPNSPEPAQKKRKRGSGTALFDNVPIRPLKRVRAKPSPSKLQNFWTPTSSLDSEPADDEPLRLSHERVSDQNQVRASDNERALSPPTSPEDGRPQVQDSDLSPDQHEPQFNDSDRMLNSRRSSESGTQKEVKGDKVSNRLLENLSNDKQYPLSPASTAVSTSDSTNSISFSSSEAVVDQVTIKVETVEASSLETDTIVVARDDQTAALPSPVTDEEVKGPTAITNLAITKMTKIAPALPSDITSVLPSIEPQPLTTTTTTTLAQLTVKPLSDKVRVPGDYILTRKLLAQPHDRWVQCHNERCQGCFIQPNGYQTRRECPRCERHSMLYGFSWPKTDPDPRKLLERSPGGRKGKGKTERSAYRRAGRCGKGTWYEGGGDEEERVMDHRTVHRFVLPEDEKAITRRGLLKQAETVRTSGSDFDLSEMGNANRKRTESVGLGGLTNSPADRDSSTPDGEVRRRSHRFVTRVGLYADV